MIRFVSVPHSVTCNRDKSIMLQRNKARPDVFRGLNVEILPLIDKKTVISNITFFKLEITSDESGYQKCN